LHKAPDLAQLVERHGLVEMILTHLTPGATSDDVLLEVVVSSPPPPVYGPLPNLTPALIRADILFLPPVGIVPPKPTCGICTPFPWR
jgi:hypothetical protein